MRTRLLSLLLVLMSISLAAISVPAAGATAGAAQQDTYLNRLNDTSRLAALAQQYGGTADLVTLRSYLTRYDAVYGVAAMVVRFDRSVRCASRPGLSAATPAVRSALTTALAGRPSADPPVIWPWEKGPLVVAVPIVEGGDVTGAAVTLASTGRLHDRMLSAWAFVALVAVAALLVCVLLAVRLTRWMLRPVHALDTATHTIARGRLDARVSGATGPPEMRRLAGSFNEMADQVENAIERQRSFVADASHQLRNPLSALLLRLEHLGTALPPGWEEELAGAREEGARLTHILDDLLTLAAAEHTAFERHPAEVSALADERVDAWAAMAEHRGITLVREGAERAWALADEAALRGVLDVLISNAIKFGPPGSRVSVTVRERDEATVAVEVRDEGEGLAEEELARLGDRFWRSPRHQNVEGSGLGIAIARTILDGIGGRLELTAGEPRGLLATVLLDAAPEP
jgi:signal transduction histidine kinase